MRFNNNHFTEEEIKAKLDRIRGSYLRLESISKLKKLTKSEIKQKGKLLIKLKMFEGLWQGLNPKS